MAQYTFINSLVVPAAREQEFIEKWDTGAASVRGRQPTQSSIRLTRQAALRF
jgi:hypothetical protein